MIGFPALALLFLPAITQNGKTFESITAKSLSAHLKFLSSDFLEGRGTPSKGLDIAAEYIASQFQLAGLESIEGFVNANPNLAAQKTGLNSYFQVTQFENRRTKLKGDVKNVIGVIQGSDPKLKNTFVIVSAHYDHLGMREGEGDTIFNGANDDGSGTVGVIDCAQALANSKPKRTLVFVCFWGEEMGLRGSSYYCKNPVLPLKDTIVDINLEQIGRTDDTEGERISEFNITGFDYTNLSDFMSKSAKPFGVKVTKHPKLSDPFFFASDNAAFASAGVPANTISTSYEFPDYHKVGDEWQKIDYENMVKIVRSICSAVQVIGNSATEVKWNESNEKTKKYAEAQKQLRKS